MALYEELDDRGVRSSDAVIDVVMPSSQDIAYPSETCFSRVGTGVDLAMLFSSALEAMDLCPFLLVRPHRRVYVGVGVWGDPSDVDLYAADPVIVAFDPSSLGDSDFWSAIGSGFRSYAEDYALYESDGFLQVNIPAARAEGVSPAPCFSVKDQ
jgi:hypothetical protein